MVNGDRNVACEADNCHTKLSFLRQAMVEDAKSDLKNWRLSLSSSDTFTVMYL